MRRRRVPKAVAVVRRKIERNEDPTAEELLAVIAETRKLIPPEFRRVMGKTREAQTPLVATATTIDAATPLDAATTLDEFEIATVRETLASVIDELKLLVQAEQQQLLEDALDAYYGIEEASARDPKNAQLLATLEKLRKAYEKSYGSPVPTKEETEARRLWEKMEDAKET
jgi:hypothetical protein